MALRFQATRAPAVSAMMSNRTTDPVRRMATFSSVQMNDSRASLLDERQGWESTRPGCDVQQFYNNRTIGAKKKVPQAPGATTLRSHAAFQLFGVGGDRVAVDFEVLVLAVATGADQAGAEQLLHVVGDSALRDRKDVTQSLT